MIEFIDANEAVTFFIVWGRRKENSSIEVRRLHQKEVGAKPLSMLAAAYSGYGVVDVRCFGVATRAASNQAP